MTAGDDCQNGMCFLLSAQHRHEMAPFWSNLANTLNLVGGDPVRTKKLFEELQRAAHPDNFQIEVISDSEDTSMISGPSRETVENSTLPKSSTLSGLAEAPATIQEGDEEGQSSPSREEEKPQTNWNVSSHKNKVHPGKPLKPGVLENVMAVDNDELQKTGSQLLVKMFRKASVGATTSVRTVARKASAFSSSRRHSTDMEEVPKVQVKLPWYQRIPVIMPESPPRMIWDVYMMFLIFYYAIAVPVRVGFDLDAPHVWLENFFTFCFLIDIILNFNTAVKVKAEYIMSRYGIAKDYFVTGWFWIDLIATFPFDMLQMGSGNEDSSDGQSAKVLRIGKIFRLLRIFKLLRLLKLGRIMKRLKQTVQVNPTAMMLGKTVVSMGAILHWMACAYWLVVDSEGATVREAIGPEEYWHPPEYVLESKELGLKYAYAFFWALSATIGVGWDIIPGTQVQVGFSAVMIMIGSMWYITIIGTVTTLLSSFSAANSKKVAQLETVMAFLKRQMVSKQLSKRVQDYYEFMWDEGSLDESKAHVEELPSSLQIALAGDMHKRLFAQIPVFHGLDPKAIFYLINNWEKRVYLPGDYVVEQGVKSSTLFIIIRGTVRLFVSTKYSSDLFLTDLERGKFFGENAMLPQAISGDDGTAHATAKAMNFSELIAISKTIYTEMVAEFRLEGTVMESLRKTHRRRIARIRWKTALAKVSVVVKLSIMSRKLAEKKLQERQGRFGKMRPQSFMRRPSDLRRNLSRGPSISRGSRSSIGT